MTDACLQESHFEYCLILNEGIIDAIDALKALDKQEPVAWVYPEGLEALKAGKPWTAYGTRQEPNNTALYLSPQPEQGNKNEVWFNYGFEY